jgi:putative restriction endonuclease
MPGDANLSSARRVSDGVATGTRRQHVESLDAVLSRLPDRHGQALRWFAEHEDQDVVWPKPLPDGTLVVCRPKGIYKPAWSKYALSVRESLDLPYPNEQPVRRPDGSWRYRYSQENPQAAPREAAFTNAGLVACIEDGVPVGVLRQVRRTPQPRYHVLGLAHVCGWRGGFFELESAPPA